jgi:uncharacterized protein
VNYVLFYGGPMAAGHNESPEPASNEETLAKIEVHFPAHRQRLDQFHADGRLLMVGAFVDPMTNGSMGIFRTREDAKAFVEDDPFIVNGIVRAWRMIEWDEVMSP